MLNTDAGRGSLAAIVVIALIALLAWARNDPGVGGREPDPPQSTQVVTDGDTVPPPDTTVVTDGDTAPPTT